MLGLPLDAWLLLFLAVGLGLGLELAFYRARKGRTERVYTAGHASTESRGKDPPGTESASPSPRGDA